MFKRFVSVVIVLVFTLSVLASCSDELKTMEMGEVSVDSVDVVVSDTSKVFATDSNYISDSLFKYLYIYFKEAFLSQAMYYESMGVSVTGDENIKAGDTEAFWNCKYTDGEDGNPVTMKDYVYENAFNVAKDILALETVAKDYKFIYPDDYKKDLEAAIYSDVEANGSNYLDSSVEFADEEGVVYPWVKARREMYLASKGITAEEWERVFFLYKTVFAENIMQHLEFVGVIAPEADEEIDKMAREYLEEMLENYLKDNAKVDILFYEYKVVKDEAQSKSSESTDSVSEDASLDNSDDVSNDDISEDTSEDELPLEEYNEQLKENCQAVLESIIDGTLSFDDESKNADNSSKDSIVTNASLVEAFGEKAKECKNGDIKLFDTDHGIYILIFKELTEVDFGRTTVPTEKEIEEFKAQSLEVALNDFLEKYNEAVVINEEALEKYNRPWEIK